MAAGTATEGSRSVDITVTHRHDWGVGWIAAEPAHMRRASHALAHEGGVWLVDPVDGEGLDEAIAGLGEVRGVLQLLDRHPRDCAALAARFGAPLLRTPFARVAGAPFEAVAVMRRRGWDETALWWPEHAVLAVAESLGTAPYYRAPGEPLGVHPLLRLTPPRTAGGLRPCAPPGRPRRAAGGPGRGRSGAGRGGGQPPPDPSLARRPPAGVARRLTAAASGHQPGPVLTGSAASLR